MDTRHRVSLLFAFILTVVLLTGSSYAIPAFSRQYGTSCSTCHVDFPKLNDFGKAFKDAGFKFPKDDETFIKVPPVMLGAPAQKELWPHTIFPGVIPGLPPISLRFNQFFQVTSNNRNNFNAQLPAGTVGSFIPRTDFQPGLFSIFTGGNFGSDIAFWVDDDISVSGANANGGLGDAYLRFVNVGRFLKMPTDSLTLKVGQFELDLPFTQARGYDISPYDIYTQANIGAVNPAYPQQFVSNSFTLAGPGRGVELSGGHHYGGYRYAIAIVDQNTSGSPPTNYPNVPSGTGGNSGGVGFFSDSNFKDLYGRLAYRFNLERDPASRHEVQAAGATGPRDHTYLTLGTYYLYGRSVQRTSGFLPNGTTATVLTAREPFYRLGGDFDFNYRSLDIYGLYMYGHDNDVLPFIPAGLTGPTGFISGNPATFSGGFIQADYLVYPWMMTILRWDRVGSTADQLNGFLAGSSGAPSTPFFSPFSSVRNRFTPGVQFLIHANIKASFEYQVRPKQVVYAPGTTVQLVSPFRTNTATAALEFVY
ncbi:MAG TPA: hypothetical protein VN948_09320 [Terriglobales bacterium]|nr:hypothetical protein [Terriglobales bacterium]